MRESKSSRGWSSTFQSCGYYITNIIPFFFPLSWVWGVIEFQLSNFLFLWHFDHGDNFENK